MEGTFGLTQPEQIQPPKLLAPKQSAGEASQQTAKNQKSSASRLPQVKKQIQSESKSLPKQTKIEEFREALDKAITVQPSIFLQNIKKNQKAQNKKLLQQPKLVQKEIEKKEKANQLQAIQQAYAEKVEDHYSKLYQIKDKPQLITAELRELEKKQNIQKELQKQEDKINRDKQHHDKLLYEIKQKVIKIKKLDEIISTLPEADENNQEVIQEKLNEEEEQQRKLALLGHEIAILKGMYESRRLLLIQTQKKLKNTYYDLEAADQKLEINQHSVMLTQKNLQSLSKIVQRYRQEQVYSSNFGATLKQRFDPLLEEKLEDELSQFVDVKALQKVLDKEKEIKEEQRKRDKQSKIDQQKQAFQEMEVATQNTKQENKKITSQLHEKEKLFEKLQRVTNIHEIKDILQHRGKMDIGMKELKEIEQFVQRELERFEIENNQIRQKIKILKYEENNMLLEQQLKIDDLERDLAKENELFSEKEKQLKKVEKSIDEVTMALSRISFQLQGKAPKQKNIEITRKSIVGVSSGIQLRLERMLTVLSKTQEFLNEESVNTNPRIAQVPDFLGINTKRYADIEQIDLIETLNDREEDNPYTEDKDFEQYRQEFKGELDLEKEKPLIAQKALEKKIKDKKK